MGKARIIVAVVLALVLGLLGVILASILPLPAPTTLTQTKIIYSAAGVFIAILVFGSLASWTIHTATTLTRKLILRLAAEIINQLTHLTSSGIPFLVGSRDSTESNIKFSNPIIVDTSALIDGRILDITKTGFIYGVLLIPDFVLKELQQVADSADDLKRTRGRRGFEIVAELKKLRSVKMEVWDKDVAGKNVDDKLVRLGRILKGRILTADFNLNRVAGISGVIVLNINNLANALRVLPVPGEKINIKVVHLGKDSSQGVGYLDDGTMVVIKEAAAEINKDTLVEVTKVLQGQAGRMIFAKKVE